MRRVLSYDGTDLYEFVGDERRMTFWVIHGLDDGIEVRGVDTVIPGTAGRTERNRVRDRHIIEIQGWVRGTGADPGADMREAMETLRALLDPTRSSATLLVQLEDESSTASISCRPLPDTMAEYTDAYAIGMNVLFEAIGDDWTVTLAGS